MSLVLEAIARHAQAAGDRPALRGAGIVMSYAQLDDLVRSLAQAISPLLSDARGCVGISLPNGPAWVILDLVMMRLRRAALPLPSFFTGQQCDAALSDAGADWVIEEAGEGGAPLSIAGSAIWIRRLHGDASRLPTLTAKVTYTSGSTGAPKGVCLSQVQMERVAHAIVERFGVRFAGVHAPILPLGVLLENVAGLYAVLLAGGCYHVESPEELGCANPFKPDFARMGHALRGAQATSLILVPELLRGIMATSAFGGMHLSTLNLVAVGGAKLAPDLITMARSLNLPVFEGYGLTECASVVSVNAPAMDRVGTVGKPLSHVNVDVVDDGEIIVGGETFLGYAGREVHCGPTQTGDIGHLDQDGFLQVTGRKSNLIITSFGRNISPEWVESELLAEPLIRHALVFGEGRAELRALIAPVFTNVERDNVAHSIERANGRLPEYARIGAFELMAPLSVEAGNLTGNGRPRRDTILAAHAAFVSG
ncbi:MAG: AMP-binding protein [Proteobacteria bacterium]|nr:AMP-binding protein [Pseudomonadota bacterium]